MAQLRTPEWISERVEIDDSGCWLWTKYTTKTGYGRLRLDGATIGAHRLTYLMWKGEIPEGYELDHLCRVRRCVNPDHLEAVTHAENMKRGIWPAKTRCPSGHFLSGDNLKLNSRGHRVCVDCGLRHNREHQRRRRARLREGV